MTTLYLKKCWRCNEEQPHRIIKMHRMKGIKLQCLGCRKIGVRYVRDVSDLKEMESLK